MRLLLDTHTLLWWLGDAPQLSARARDAIGRVEAEVFVMQAASTSRTAIRSTVCCWRNLWPRA